MPDQYFGKYTGIVKDNRDPAGLGRVKVSVPAIFPPDELMQARAALPYGYFFVPENDTKVWVEFEGGDPGLVLWTGVQYVSGEWPAAAQADPPQYRVIASPGGHVLLLDDKPGEEQVRITVGEQGHELVLDGTGVTVTDGRNGHSLTLDASGVTVTDGANGHSIALASSGIVARTSGGATIELTAAGASVDAGPGIVEVKGSLVKLGAGAVPVIRVGDSGIGNLGAPVVMAVTTNTQVLA